MMLLPVKRFAGVWKVPPYDDEWNLQRQASLGSPAETIIIFLRKALARGNHQRQYLRKAAKLLIELERLIERYQTNAMAFQKIIGGRRIIQRLRSNTLSNEVESAVARDEGPNAAILLKANEHLALTGLDHLDQEDLLTACRLLHERLLLSGAELASIEGHYS